MTDDFFVSLGKGINEFIRGISGVPTSLTQKPQSIDISNTTSQQINQVSQQQKVPCSTCGQNKQEEQKHDISNEINTVSFNGGPSRIVRRKEQITNDNYKTNEIHFS